MGETSSAGMSIGQMAERTGLSVYTLRFYEREGILANPVRRGPGGRPWSGAETAMSNSGSTCFASTRSGCWARWTPSSSAST